MKHTELREAVGMTNGSSSEQEQILLSASEVMIPMKATGSVTAMTEASRREMNGREMLPLPLMPPTPLLLKARCSNCVARGLGCNDVGHECTNCRRLNTQCLYQWQIDGRSLGDVSPFITDLRLQL